MSIFYKDRDGDILQLSGKLCSMIEDKAGNFLFDGDRVLYQDTEYTVRFIEGRFRLMPEKYGVSIYDKDLISKL
jgi:hypothetical protein